MKKLSIILLMLMCMVFVSSCTHRLTDFTVISTKNVPITESATKFKKGDQRIKGVDVGHQILIVPGVPNMKEAIDKAIQSTPGAVGLVDGVIKQNSWTCFFYGQNKYIVEGTPLFPIANNEVVEEDAVYIPTKNQKNKKTRNYHDEDEDYYVEDEPQATITTFSHQVQPGETLNSIAEIYDVSVRDLIKWNKLKSNSIKGRKNIVIRIAE